MAQLVSINVGGPRAVAWQGQFVSTGIFKSPVDGPVELRSTNLAGDRQADLNNHGGEEKAVYCFAHELYQGWRSSLSGMTLRWVNLAKTLPPRVCATTWYASAMSTKLVRPGCK